MIRLNERLAIFIGLALLNIIYFACRSVDYIAHLYIGLSYVKNLLMIVAVYSASKFRMSTKIGKFSNSWFLFFYLLVVPELKCKFVPLIVRILTGGFYLWSITSVVILYSIYYDHESSWWSSIASGIQYFVLAGGVCTVFMWVRLWLKKQNDDRLELNLEEFTFLFFLIPTILYAPDGSIWGLAAGISQYKNRNEADLIFLIGSHLTFAMVLIGKIFIIF